MARRHWGADETIATGRADAATARSATSVATARESTRDFLERLVHPIAPEAADTVVLVVSELVTSPTKCSRSASARTAMPSNRSSPT
ncbi:hypothetical protein [Streptomyces canus]|uniref:hypothetical protein n=1 Tax=Streptomyces canus TaxID=58343 RepID=UPI002B1D7CC7|nr:hypothetical protein [Streptomyces canus]